MLNHRLGIPLYYQIQEYFLDSISRGDLKPGDPLPSVKEICETFDVSHITVTKALSKLINQGYLESIQGKGTFVSTVFKFNQQLLRLTSFTDDVLESHLQPSSIILNKEVKPANESIASKLMMKEGDEVVYLERLRKANDEPVLLERIHLNHNLCPKILRFNFEKISLYHILSKEYGLKLTRSNYIYEAVILRQDEVELFGVTQRLPAIYSELIVYLNSGKPIEFAKQIYRGDRYRFIGEADGYKH